MVPRRHRNTEPSNALSRRHRRGGVSMLQMAFLFLLAALVAGVLGFGGFISGVAGIFRIMFVGFSILTLVSFAAHAIQDRTPPA
jgi:uncharacterized membrane protein YtjA (UPF0391 family)